MKIAGFIEQLGTTRVVRSISVSGICGQVVHVPFWDSRCRNKLKAPLAANFTDRDNAAEHVDGGKREFNSTKSET